MTCKAVAADVGSNDSIINTTSANSALLLSIMKFALHQEMHPDILETGLSFYVNDGESYWRKAISDEYWNMACGWNNRCCRWFFLFLDASFACFFFVTKRRLMCTRVRSESSACSLAGCSSSSAAGLIQSVTGVTEWEGTEVKCTVI